jgi:hypothetical protein
MMKDDARGSAGTMIATMPNAKTRHAPRHQAQQPLLPLSHLSNTGDVASCAR